MSHLFDPDSPLMTALSAVMDFFVLSIITLVCALPVITAGPSVCALYCVMVDRISGSSASPYRDFFSHLRRCFKSAIVCWLMFLATAYFLYLELQVIGGMPESYRVFFFAGAFFLCFCLLLAGTCLPPLIASDPNRPILRLWQNALFRGIAYIPRAIAILAILAVPLAVLIFSLRWFWTLLLLWIFVWPAISGWVWARLTFNMLRP